MNLRSRSLESLAVAWLIAVPSLAQLGPAGNYRVSSSLAGDQFGSSILAADVDGDGRGDLLISGRGPGSAYAGLVRAYRSTGTGLQALPSLPGTASSLVPAAMTAGRFVFSLPPGRPQVVIGSPNEDQVRIFALRQDGNWSRPQVLNSTNLPFHDSADGYLGIAVAAGDFDGDGADDLAIGAPYKDVPGAEDAGEVVAIYGGSSGLDLSTAQAWNEDSPGHPDGADENDLFGWALAAGDFDGDGYDDLAIGSPGEIDIAPWQNFGGVTILFGSAGGLTTAGVQFFDRESSIVPGGVGSLSEFGAVLASGRLAHDHPSQSGDDEEDDLVIASPHHTVNGVGWAGSVVLLVGRQGGFTAAGARRFSQQELPDAAPEDADRFGASLAIGDFDGDGWDDLAVGVAEESFNGVDDHGVAHEIRGGPNGLRLSSARLLSFGAGYAIHPLEANDHAAAALAAPDLDADGRADLAVGVPFWEANSSLDSGAVQIVFGGH